MLLRVLASHVPAYTEALTIACRAIWDATPEISFAADFSVTDELVAAGYRVYEIPMERECRRHVSDARRGKNMFVLGMLCSIYSLDMQLAREQIARIFGKKDQFPSGIRELFHSDSQVYLHS